MPTIPKFTTKQGLDLQPGELVTLGRSKELTLGIVAAKRKNEERNRCIQLFIPETPQISVEEAISNDALVLSFGSDWLLDASAKDVQFPLHPTDVGFNCIFVGGDASYLVYTPPLSERSNRGYRSYFNLDNFQISAEPVRNGGEIQIWRIWMTAEDRLVPGMPPIYSKT